jgi:hypothetical protein
VGDDVENEARCGQCSYVGSNCLSTLFCSVYDILVNIRLTDYSACDEKQLAGKCGCCALEVKYCLLGDVMVKREI